MLAIKNFLKRKPKLNESRLKRVIFQLEDAFTNKQINKLTGMFHPDSRDISFLNHFSLMMNFQIYNITSEILHMEILDVNENTATLTYTRKHIYTCIQKEDENGTNPNNISSYYVKVVLENKRIWIEKYSRYSELFLDLEGNLYLGEEAVVPPSAQYFNQMEWFIQIIKQEHLKPATYLMYDGSEMIGYYPIKERYSYYSTEKLTFDYFEEMDADTMVQHTEYLIDSNELETSKIIQQDDQHSIIELTFMSNHTLQYELICSVLVNNNLLMARYLINEEKREKSIQNSLIEQMIQATKRNANE